MQKAIPLEKLKSLWGNSEEHQAQDQGQQRPWPPCNSRPDLFRLIKHHTDWNRQATLQLQKRENGHSNVAHFSFQLHYFHRKTEEISWLDYYYFINTYSIKLHTKHKIDLEKARQRRKVENVLITKRFRLPPPNFFCLSSNRQHSREDCKDINKYKTLSCMGLTRRQLLTADINVHACCKVHNK